VRFESGALGVIEATTCCNPPLCSRIEVFGTTGAASFDDANVVSFGTGGEDRLAECSEESGSIGGRSDPMAISMKGHADLAADFVAAVREGREPIVGGEQARMSLEALTLIYRAGGRSV
jgi:predicted dehydrogenase